MCTAPRIAALAFVLIALTPVAGSATEVNEIVLADDLRPVLGIESPKVQLADTLLRIERGTGNLSQYPIMAIETVLRSAASVATRKVFGVDPPTVRRPDTILTGEEDEVSVIARFYEYPQGILNPSTSYGRLVVAISPMEDHAIADKLLSATKDALLQIMQEEDEKANAKVESMLAAAKRDVGSAQQKFDELQDRQAQLMAQSELPYEVLQDSIASLQRDKQSIQLELVGLQAREAAIQQQVKKAAERTKTGPNAEIIDNLSEILSVRERDFERAEALQKAASMSQQEVLRVREQLLMAKIELAKARAAANDNGPQVDRFNTDLAQVSIDTTVAKARLEFVERELTNQLARSREQRNIEQELQDLDIQVREARQRVEETRESVQNISKSLAELKTTTIEVIEKDQLPH